MDTMCSNFDHTLFLTKGNAGFENGKKKYTNVVLSNTTDDTLTGLKKLTLTIPNREINFTNNNYIGVVSDFVECINDTAKCENNVFIDNNIEFNKINYCSKTKMNTTEIKKNVNSKNTNKKQTNISFSNEKLWEINRVNQILHNKISSGVKPTYSRKNAAIFVKAASAINRERKNKDIAKANEILAKKLKNVTSSISK